MDFLREYGEYLRRGWGPQAWAELDVPSKVEEWKAWSEGENVHCRMARVRYQWRQDREALKECQAALQDSLTDEQKAGVRIIESSAMERLGRIKAWEHRDSIQEGLRLADALNDTQLKARFLRYHAMTMDYQIDARGQTLEQALDLATDPAQRILITRERMYFRCAHRDYEGALALYDAMVGELATPPPAELHPQLAQLLIAKAYVYVVTDSSRELIAVGERMRELQLEGYDKAERYDELAKRMMEAQIPQSDGDRAVAAEYALHDLGDHYAGRPLEGQGRGGRLPPYAKEEAAGGRWSRDATAPRRGERVCNRSGTARPDC